MDLKKIKWKCADRVHVAQDRASGWCREQDTAAKQHSISYKLKFYSW